MYNYKLKPSKMLKNPAKNLLLLSALYLICSCGRVTETNNGKSSFQDDESWKNMIEKAGKLGKSEWQPMLKYVAELHRRSTHDAKYPFDFEWEEIGPGYIYGPAFGHWDIIHQSLDVMNLFPQHALHQLYNISSKFFFQKYIL